MSIPPTPIPRENPGAGLPYGALEHAAKYLVVVQRLRYEGITFFGFVMVMGFNGYAMFFAFRGSIPLSRTGQLIGIFCFALSVLLLLIVNVVMIIAPSRGSILFGELVRTFTTLCFGIFFLHAQAPILVALYVLANIGFTTWAIKHSMTECALLDSPPLPLSLTLADNLLNRLRDASPKADSACVEINTIGYPYRILLLDDVAVLAQVGGGPFRPIREIRFLSPLELTIESEHKKCFNGRNAKCQYRIEGKTFSGSISPESFARYQGWKERFALPANTSLEE